jgi:hypothetical protein
VRDARSWVRVRPFRSNEWRRDVVVGVRLIDERLDLLVVKAESARIRKLCQTLVVRLLGLQQMTHRPWPRRSSPRQSKRGTLFPPHAHLWHPQYSADSMIPGVSKLLQRSTLTHLVASEHQSIGAS